MTSVSGALAGWGTWGIVTTETHLDFIERFNAALVRLDCGARVTAVSGTACVMEIVDLDGAAVGRIPTRIEPETFAAFMLLVEESFAEGVRIGRAQHTMVARH